MAKAINTFQLSIDKFNSDKIQIVFGHSSHQFQCEVVSLAVKFIDNPHSNINNRKITRNGAESIPLIQFKNVKSISMRGICKWFMINGTIDFKCNKKN